MLQIRMRTLKYFGYIKRHERLRKTIMEGGMPAKRREIPRRRWIQDTTDDLSMTAAERRRTSGL
uniref:Uncharacterized protein n=1 Tax=Arion vulgaris TaxID=1028688 RepID=A0A0B7AQM8_9EUPU